MDHGVVVVVRYKVTELGLQELLDQRYKFIK